MLQKSVVASPGNYPKQPQGGYAESFKKGAAERALLKEKKEEWKVLINAEWGHILPKRLLKKINNPTDYRLTS